MAGAVSIDVMMNLVFGAISGDREARRQLDTLFAESSASGLKKGAKESTKTIKAEWAPALAKMSEAGMRKAGDVLVKSYEESARVQMTSAMKIASLQRKLDKGQDAATKNSLLRQKQALQDRIDLEVVAQKKLLRAGEKNADKILDLRKQHQEKMDRSSAENMQVAGENFAGAIEAAFSADNIDAKGLTQGIGSMLSKGIMSAAGSASATAGGGATAAGLASAATAIAGVVASLAAIAGIFAAAAGQATAMNKALMESSSAADITGGSLDSVTASAAGLTAEYGQLNFRLKMLRRVTIDTASDFRMSKEEVSGYIGALNEAGLTMREFRGMVSDSTSDMQAYRDVTQTAIIASQGLGISASETADFMNKIQRDMGGSLGDVQGAFGMIYSEAKKAGMSTKDFFSAINEASSGMALYNFRVGDTVGLFTDLVKIMGEDLAKQQMGLEGTFKGMGEQEKHKTTMLGGSGMKAGVLASAERQGQAFGDALKAAGVTMGGGISGKDGSFDLKAVAKLSGEGYRAELTKLKKADEEARKRGEEGNLARTFQTVRTVSQATKGTTEGTSGALAGLDRMGELTAQAMSGGGMLGGKTLQESLDAGGISAMHAEEATGMSGDQLANVAKIQTSMIAEWEDMTGKTFGADTKDEFATAFGSGILSQTDDLKAASEKQYSMLEQSAVDQLQETRSMSQSITNKIAGFLENIWLGIEHLLTMLGSSRMLFPTGGGSKMEDRRDSMKKEEQSARALEQISNDLNDAKGARTTAATSDEKVRLDKKIQALEAKAATEREAIEVERDARRRLVSGESPTIQDARKNAGLDAQFGPGSAERARGLLTSLSGDKAAEMGLVGSSEWEKTQVKSDMKGLAESGSPEAFKAMETLLTEQLDAEKEKAAADEMLAGTEAQRDEATAQMMENELSAVVNQIRSLPMEEQRVMMQNSLSGLGAEKAQDLTSRAFAAQTSEEKASISREIEAALLAQNGEIAGALAGQFQGYGLNVRPSVKDFIYRGDGSGSGDITPIDKADEFFGAKPGGPIAGGMGGSKMVNITINGGDEARVYNVVKRVLRDSGYGDMKKY